MRRVIIMTQRIVFYKSRNEFADSLDRKYIEYFNQLSIPIIIVPNNKDQLKIILSTVDSALIVLTGGNSMGEFKIRDEIEKILISYSIKNKIPLLAICKGMQSVANHFKVKLKIVKNHVKKKHKVNGIINGKRNSFHNYSLEQVPKNFLLLAESSDSSIEAIRHNTLPLECWMWHPERERIFNKDDLNRIKELVGK